MCLAVDSFGFSSSSICLALEELGAALLRLSIMYFRIVMDSLAWLHMFDKWLNCSWREETLCKKRSISARYLSLMMRFWSSILAFKILCWLSKTFCWALISSISACRSEQCKKSSLRVIVDAEEGEIRGRMGAEGLPKDSVNTAGSRDLPGYKGRWGELGNNDMKKLPEDLVYSTGGRVPPGYRGGDE